MPPPATPGALRQYNLRSRYRPRNLRPRRPATAGSAHSRTADLRHLLIATSNPGKVREFREMLGGERFQWDDLSKHASFKSVAETGQTFLANACLKAEGYAKQFDTWALA